MKNLLLLGVAALATTAAHGQAMPLDEAARNFGSRQTFWAADISPSGNQLVVLSAGPASKTYAQVYDLETGTNRTVLMSEGKKDEIDWCRFGSESALICQMSGESHVEDQLVAWSRLAAVSTNGSHAPRMLGQKQTWYDSRIRQFDGHILDWLPGENAVLMAREYVPQMGRTGSRIARTKSGLGVDLVDLEDFDRKTVEQPADVSSYITDGQGNVRIRMIRERESATGNLTGRTSFDYRQAGSDKWRDLSVHEPDDSGFWPLAVERQTDSVYGLEKLDGRDALYRIKLDGSGEKTLVAAHDRVDIAGTVRLGRGLEIIGYHYTDERSHIEYFDPKYEALSSALGNALPNSPIINFRGASADGDVLLLSAGSDANPGELYMLRQSSKEMSPLMQIRPQFEGQALARVEPVQYRARDGAMIPAYVTLPKDRGDKAVGAVVLPHGGPSARDYWGFDWARPILRCARLCGDPAQLSRLGGLWR